MISLLWVMFSLYVYWKTRSKAAFVFLMSCVPITIVILNITCMRIEQIPFTLEWIMCVVLYLIFSFFIIGGCFFIFAQRFKTGLLYMITAIVCILLCEKIDIYEVLDAKKSNPEVHQEN